MMRCRVKPGIELRVVLLRKKFSGGADVAESRTGEGGADPNRHDGP